MSIDRHELFDDAFQDELEEMYRQTGQGQSPRAPAMMCMGLLLQAYLQTSDAEAVRLSTTDRCWQAVLGTLEEEEGQPAFSQGGLQQFRERLISSEMDRRLLERTVELAKRTKGFDPKKTPKTLRVGVDSRPLEGAGRVEDTINLLGHAGRKIAESVALVLGTDVDEVCQQADVPLLMASSIKAGLDIDWGAPGAKHHGGVPHGEAASRAWSPSRRSPGARPPVREGRRDFASWFQIIAAFRIAVCQRLLEVGPLWRLKLSCP